MERYFKGYIKEIDQNANLLMNLIMKKRYVTKKGEAFLIVIIVWKEESINHSMVILMQFYDEFANCKQYV